MPQSPTDDIVPSDFLQNIRLIMTFIKNILDSEQKAQEIEENARKEAVTKIENARVAQQKKHDELAKNLSETRKKEIEGQKAELSALYQDILKNAKEEALKINSEADQKIPTAVEFVIKNLSV